MNRTEDPTQAKERELLPDILTHQGHVRDQIRTIEASLSAFDNAWRLAVTEPELKPKDSEKLSTFDSIYRENSIITDRLEQIIKHLNEIRAKYLGST